MMLAHSLLFSAFCAISLLPAPRTTEPPVLSVSLLPAAVEFRIEAEDAPFIAAVIGSLSSTTENYLVGLPPLLADFVVINVGISEEATYTAVMPESIFPLGIFIYAQGVTLTNGVLEASNVDDFVLDGGPIRGGR